MQLLQSTLILSALASGVFTSPIAGSSKEHKSSPQSSKASKQAFPNSHSTPTPTPVSTPVPSSGNSSSGNGDLGIPAGLLTSKAGISFGFLPDTNGVKMSQINSALGKKSAAFGWYSQIGSTHYDDSQLTQVMNDVVSSGGVFIPAVMPTGLKFNQIDANVASQVAASMKKFTDKGVEVWLRFAHEMNYYVSNEGPKYPGGSPQEFVTAWKAIRAAVASNPKVKMFWSPNSAKSADLKQWFPGPEAVDMVGMDVYPKQSDATFASTYGDFYNAFSKPYNLPFVVGETGAGSSEVSAKEAWLKQLTNADYSQFPNYKSASWFEYNKEQDFHIAVDVDASTLQQTKSNFQ